MTPEQNLTTTTNIIWTYNLSTDPDGDSIPVAEWTVDGIIKSNPNGMLSTGSHTISLKVQDSKGLWSQSVSTIVSVSTSQPLYVTNGLILDLEPNLYTGTQWTDKTLNMYNGTIKNFTNPTWGIVGGINGLRFTNSSNYLEFPAITANVKTIEYWIYLNTLATSVCTQVYQDPTIYHLLSIYNAYPLATLWADRTQSYSSVSPQLKVWQHVVVDTVNKKLYLNGKNVTTPMSISWTPDNFSPRFGQGYSGYTSFDGYLGSIRIYNRALTQAEITTNYGVGIK